MLLGGGDYQGFSLTFPTTYNSSALIIFVAYTVRGKSHFNSVGCASPGGRGSEK